MDMPNMSLRGVQMVGPSYGREPRARLSGRHGLVAFRIWDQAEVR